MDQTNICQNGKSAIQDLVFGKEARVAGLLNQCYYGSVTVRYVIMQPLLA